tara:strand:- start:1006 stop:1167 length:162 start_codon:yes stop_codon:yes gene_type:complete
MDKLEKVIEKTLDKFKDNQVNLLSEVARKVLVTAIARDIYSEIEQERKRKQCS